MGTWSHEPFGNDSANDWAYDLEDQSDLSLVVGAIQAVLDNGDDYLDSDLAVEAVAAAEVLAKMLGRGTQSDAYTEKVPLLNFEWVAARIDRSLGPLSEGT